MTANAKPNIIFFMTDQHRWDALGCVNPIIKTPNLDRLAASGVRFDQAVCNAPMCIPSRYSMMTGLLPSQCGVRHNTSFCATDDELADKVLPQYITEAGYQTAGFGKTHWYLGSQVKNEITNVVTSRRGFEYRASARPIDPLRNEPDEILMDRQDHEAYQRMADETASFGVGGESPEGYMGLTSHIPLNETREGWLTDECLKFLDTERDHDRPLMLYLSFDFPHAAFNCPEKYEKLYNIDDIPDQPQPDWYGDMENRPVGHVGRDRRAPAWDKLTPAERRRTTLRYYGLCSFVDDMFGRVLAKLEADGILDNALIVFVSDHGEMLGQRDSTFSKYCLYDGSVRVPVILSGSAVPEELRGTVDDRPAELVDILPTLLDVTGLPKRLDLPGRSLLEKPCRLGSFCEMHGSGYSPTEQAPAFMWRTRDYKLIVSIPGEMSTAAMRLDEMRGELYSLADDPHEWNNLWDDPACRDIRERMLCQLLMHLGCMWSRYPRKTSRCELVE